MSEPRLTAEEASAVLARATPIPTTRGAAATRPAAFVLAAPGATSKIDFTELEHRVLLLFASGDCQGCEDLLGWPRDPAHFGLEADDVVMVVVRTPEERDALGEGLWASAQAFEACRVAGAPFFVLLDPAYATVATEGVVWGLDSVTQAIAAARSGAPQVEVNRLEPPR